MSSLLADAVAVEYGGRSPAIQNVTFFQPYEVGQILLPDFTQCLSVKTYLKMCSIPFSVELRSNAENMSPSGKVPFIKADSLLVSEFEPIITFLKTKGHDLSAHLSDKDRAEMKAFLALANSKLTKAELFVTWYDEEIYQVVTKNRSGSSLTWPLSLIIPYMKRYANNKLLRATEWKDKTLEQVHKEVELVCEGFSQKLGNKKYFFGEKPTELDAAVYGHVYGLLTTALPSTNFAEIIKRYPTLVEFCTRIDGAYLTEHELR